jgi:hypothetical protein
VVDPEEFKRRLTALDAARAAVNRKLDELRILAYRPEPIAHPDDRPVEDLQAEFDELMVAEDEAAADLQALWGPSSDGHLGGGT